MYCVSMPKYTILKHAIERGGGWCNSYVFILDGVEVFLAVGSNQDKHTNKLEDFR